MTPSNLLRRVALPLLLACLSGWACAQSADIAHDTSLGKPISIKLKVAQLPDALKEISKLTGVKLASVEPINDLKVTVLVKKIPAGLVLEKIASVLGCEWVHDGDLWRLHMTLEATHDREKFVAKEDEIALQELSDEVKKLVDANGPEEAPKAGAGAPRMAKINAAVLGQVIGSLGNQQASAFWRGDVVAARDPSMNAITAVPVDPSAPTRGGRRAPVSRAAIPIFMQVDPLLYQVRYTFRGAARTFGKRPTEVVADPTPNSKLAAMPFGKAVLAWDQPVPTGGGWENVLTVPATAVSPYYSKRVSISDLYEMAFDATGVPIIADAFRVPAPGRAPTRLGSSYINWLAQMKQECHVFTRFDDGIVMSRHGGFWRLRKFETPESAFQPLEKKSEKSELSIADYASFVAKLTPPQARVLELKEEVLAQFPTQLFERSMPALQFYSTLRGREIPTAMADGINVTNMDANQRQLFSNAVVQAPFFGSASLAFYGRIVDFLVSGDLRGMGFLAKVSSVNDKNTVTPSQRLLFGLSVAEAATYTVVLE